MIKTDPYSVNSWDGYALGMACYNLMIMMMMMLLGRIFMLMQYKLVSVTETGLLMPTHELWFITAETAMKSTMVF